MNPTKLEKLLAQAKAKKQQAIKQAAFLRKQIAEKKRRLDVSLALDVGRACIALPLTPEAIAFLRRCQDHIREDHGAQVRGMLRDAEARAKMTPPEPS